MTKGFSDVFEESSGSLMQGIICKDLHKEDTNATTIQQYW